MTAIPQHFIVSGGSSGIGAAVVERLSKDGQHVTSIARRQNPSNSPGVESVCCDLSKVSSLTESLAFIRSIKNLGGAVLSHGYGDFGALEQLSANRIRQQIDTNLTSTLLMCRLIVPVLKTGGGGTIVVIGSESALKGGRQGAAYSATKFALRGMVQALRQECAGNGVRIGIVNPGMVQTPFFDDLHFKPGDAAENNLQPDDVAAAVMTMINAPANGVIDEINLSPLKTVVQQQS